MSGSPVMTSAPLLAGSACSGNCSGHGVCRHGVCICQVQWTGGECAQASYPYVVTFGTVFTILTLVSFIQLALTIYHDAQRNTKDRLREAFRFTVHKWLYFVAWLATGSRAFSFIMQEDLSSWFALNVQSIYYPFLITLGSLLACLLGERYYLDVPQSETHSIQKSFQFYVGFNVALWLTFFVMIVLTVALPVEDQAFVHSVFYLVFAALMLLSVAFFLFYGVLMFYKVTGAFKTEECRVNATQLSLSRAGVFFQGIFQLILITLLVIDFSSYFFPRGTRFFNRDLFNVVSRVTDLAVVIWFPCALWNCKRPETLWILNPRQVLYVDSGESTPLYAENQRSYGSTVRRAHSLSTTSDGFECWICYDSESKESGPLICPCACKGGTAAVHHNCLRRWLQEQGELSERKVPQCDICKKPYTMDRTRRLKLTCTVMQGLRTSLLLFALVSLPLTVTFVMRQFVFPDLLKYTVIVVTAVLELVCLRLLGVTCDSICHRALLAAVTIVGPHPSEIRGSADASTGQSADSSADSRLLQRTPSPALSSQGSRMPLDSSSSSASCQELMQSLADVDVASRSVMFSVQPVYARCLE